MKGKQGVATRRDHSLLRAWAEPEPDRAARATKQRLESGSAAKTLVKLVASNPGTGAVGAYNLAHKIVLFMFG